MLALNKSDIEDIANGNHNSYVESQDKDELLRELASRLLQATPDTSDIDDKLDDISDCLDDVDNVLRNSRTPRNIIVRVKQKLNDADKYINEVRDVLLTITE